VPAEIHSAMRWCSAWIAAVAAVGSVEDPPWAEPLTPPANAAEIAKQADTMDHNQALAHYRRALEEAQQGMKDAATWAHDARQHIGSASADLGVALKRLRAVKQAHAKATVAASPDAGKEVEIAKEEAEDAKSVAKVEAEEVQEAKEELDKYPVPDVNTQQLDALYHGNKDVLIAFYAPWCRHCQQFVLKPDASFNRIARFLKEVDTLEVVRFSVAQGKIPEPWHATFLPGIVVYSPGYEPQEYRGRDWTNLLKFIVDNSRKSTGKFPAMPTTLM